MRSHRWGSRVDSGYPGAAALMWVDRVGMGKLREDCVGGEFITPVRHINGEAECYNGVEKLLCLVLAKLTPMHVSVMRLTQANIPLCINASKWRRSPGKGHVLVCTGSWVPPPALKKERMKGGGGGH